MYTPTQRLMRSRTDRVIAGVAGGVARYLAVDSVIVRLAFVALGLTPVGWLLYPVLWLVMPLEGETGNTVNQAVDEMRQQAQRMGDDIREVFVAPNSSVRRPRFDPMTGQPLDPESEGEIPINNLNPQGPTGDVHARRNRMLGYVLLGIGAFVLISMIPGFGYLVGRFLFPAILIGAGVLLLRRNR